MAKIKRNCPYCKSEVFTRKRFEDVEIIDDEEKLIDKVINKDKSSYDEYVCEKCGKELTDEELN